MTVSYHSWKQASLLQDAMEKYKELLSEEYYELTFKKTQSTCEATGNKRKGTRRKPYYRPTNQGTTPFDNKTVISMSSCILTTTEEEILEKGLKFAETPKQAPALFIINAIEVVHVKHA